MSAKMLNYFAEGNTAVGFYDLYENNLKDLDKLFILKGAPGVGKSTLMRKIGSYFFQEGFDIEWLHNSLDHHSIDGLIIPGLKTGIVDGTAPHVIEPKIPGAVEEYVDLGRAWNSEQLNKQKELIIELTNHINESFQRAYYTFAEALKVHDEWEKIYIENMDFEKAEDFTKKLIVRFFGNQKQNKTANVRHRFLGAATSSGAVDFVQNLTEDTPYRYFIKGRPGSGKSTMLKKIAAHAEENGFDIEVYHCGFDPNSIDMVIVRELGFAIFDSTAPHEYFPSRFGDEIIDVYGTLIAPETDERYAEEISRISKRYKQKMFQATGYLAKTKEFHDNLEAIYTDVVDFNIINEIAESIKGKMLHYVEK